MVDLLDLEVEERLYLFKKILGELVKEFKFLKERIKRFEEHLQQLGKENTAVKRLMTIPGLGLIGASALVGSIGDLRHFKSGREVSA